MRKPRLIDPNGGFYHITSRVLERAKRLDAPEQERMRILLGQLSAFSGVEILTHALLGNHFHLLLEVPSAPKQPLPEETLIERLNYLPPKASTGIRPGDRLAREIHLLRQKGLHREIESKFNAVRARMYDLSRFVREFKQRFTQDFNVRHERKGTLWEERFRSTLLEPTPQTLLRVAAYIDLNPLRANLIRDPKDYRFCGYAAAVAGETTAWKGYLRLFQKAGLLQPNAPASRSSRLFAAYRVFIFHLAVPRKDSTRAKGRAGLPASVIAQIRRLEGYLDCGELLRCRQRFISEGIVLGSVCFVEDQISRWKGRNMTRNPPRHHPHPSTDWHCLQPAEIPNPH